MRASIDLTQVSGGTRPGDSGEVSEINQEGEVDKAKNGRRLLGREGYELRQDEALRTWFCGQTADIAATVVVVVHGATCNQDVLTGSCSYRLHIVGQIALLVQQSRATNQMELHF